MVYLQLISKGIARKEGEFECFGSVNNVLKI